MLRRFVAAAFAVATLGVLASAGETPDHDAIVNQVWLDARVVERVTATARGSFPDRLLEDIVDEDIDLLRGKRPNSTFEWAHFEKVEAGRVTHGGSVDAGTKERADRSEIRGRHVFQIVVQVPPRRRVVVRNPSVRITRIDFDFTTEAGAKRFETLAVDALLAPGDQKTWDLPEIASDVIATVWARSTGNASNLQLSLVRAQLFDDSDGPFFGAVQSAKLLRTAIERKDPESVKTLASTLAARLETMGAQAGMRTGGRTSSPALDSKNPSVSEIYFEIQKIEDLLTGSEDERRTGLDQLHQLVRTLRHAALR